MNISHKKQGNLAICYNMNALMDLEGIMLSERSQTEKDKYCMILLICGILKKKTTKKTYSEKKRSGL